MTPPDNDKEISLPGSLQAGLEHWITQGADLPPFGSSFTGLDTLGRSLLIAALNAKTDKSICIVFASKAVARDCVDNLAFFLGNKQKEKIHYYPPFDFDFHKGVFPDAELIFQRNMALFHALNDSAGRIFVTTPEALLQKVFPPSIFLEATQRLSKNEEWDRNKLVKALQRAGYQRQPIAYDPGVFAVRGGVVDIYSPLYRYPVRVEFFGDLIEEIRFYHPETQRSLDAVDPYSVVPVLQTLVPDASELDKIENTLKARLDEINVPKTLRDEYLNRLKSGEVSGELSLLFPLLVGGSSSFPEYLPSNTIFLWDGQRKLHELVEKDLLPRIKHHFDLYEKAPLPIAPQEELFLSLSEFERFCVKERSYFFEDFTDDKMPNNKMPNNKMRDEKGSTVWQLNSHPLELTKERQQSQSRSSHALLEPFAVKFKDWMDQGFRIHIVSHTRTHSERVQFLFEPYGLKAQFCFDFEKAFPNIFHQDWQKLHLWQGYISQSEEFPLLKLVLLSEEEIFGHKKRVSQSKVFSQSSATSKALSSFKDLKVNDYVVHKDHGIGRYLGLKSLDFQGVPNDFVLLEYRDGDKLYVPIYRLNVIQKYMGGEGARIALDKLGGDRWVTVKKKVQKAVRELAAEFLKMQAKRKLIQAHAHSEPSTDFRQFEMEFAFDETPDQAKAIEDVMHDMSQTQPMDRLIVGDVGYGKTEVAIRAAFRAVLDKKQVAVLVPTTILAFQHHETFQQRLKNFAVRVGMLSRLKGRVESQKTLKELAEGKLDILVGTHRLLSSDIQFKDLGLLVVDEEHRFGVLHKEKLKKISEKVHVVSMSATPIPRTLNMAMSGVKDITLITTPPPDRLAVRTFVCRSSDEVVSEAIRNELARAGQVFFVHNRIETIFGVADNLKRLLPKVRFCVAHGQMEGEELEKIMFDFYHGAFDVLVSTAIIESGLDIPRANTILIDESHKLGLAQLYQLRGRVGRSDKRAYCYLLIPSERELTAEAKERIGVIQRHADLGSGFNIASHDLEIRGMGNLLGKEQSGHLNAIGVDLYFELLEDSIRYLQGHEKFEEIEPEITITIPAFFPQDYLPDLTERIMIYRRLSSVDHEDEIAELEAEIRDRFGPLPKEVENLLSLMKVKLYLKKLHVTHVSCGPKRTSFKFANTTPASPEKIVELVRKDSQKYSVTPDQKFVVSLEKPDLYALATEVKRLAQLLGCGI